ncbi:unnamed protein product [Sphagnum balticum]
MSENFILQTLGFKSSSDALHDEIPELQAIDQRLLVDKANRNGQGFFARAVDAALSSIWHSDLDSEKALEALRLKVVAAQESADPGAVKKLDEEVQQAVENDQKAVQNNSFKDSASSFVGDVAVSAPLFVRGARGRALSAFANGLNDFSASDGPGGMAADALTEPLKAICFPGPSNREGNFALGQGLSITASSTFNPLALLTDVSTGIASRSIAKIADGRLDGFLSRSPLATNVLTGTTTGLISGSSAEIQRESRTGNYDFESILAGAAQGAATSAAGGALGRGLERTTIFAPTGTPATDSIMLPHPDVKAPGSTQLEELGQRPLPANPTEQGVDLKYQLTVGGIPRQVNVHLPPRFDPATPTAVYYLMDGVVINNPAGNMLGINGWAKTADQHGFVAAGLEQSTASTVRPFGITIPSSVFGKAIPSATSWSIPKVLGKGLLNPTRGINDVDFFAATHGALANAMNVEANNIVTFSDGSSLANAVAAYMPVGSIDGVANVAGTMMRGNPLPKAGINGFFVNSELDPTMKIEGGPGSGATKYLAKIGLRNIFDSRPLDQAPRYAEASGLDATPTVTDTDNFIQQNYALTPDGEATVTAFRLKIGGHTWPGRATGDGTNTALTDINGQTLTQTQFDTNNLIVEFLKRARTIQRTLDSHQ